MIQSNNPPAALQDRRARARRPLDASVRLFVLSEDNKPTIERRGEGVNIGSDGLAVAVKQPLDLGTRLVVLLEDLGSPVLWHVRVVHIHLVPDRPRVLGLQRLDMPLGLDRSQWMRALAAFR